MANYWNYNDIYKLMINLTHHYREDWKEFWAKDDAKKHWLTQRLAEDERDLLLEAPPLPKYVEEKKKLTAKELLMYGYSIMRP